MRVSSDLSLLEQHVAELKLQDYFDLDILPLCELLYFEKDEYLIHEGKSSTYLYIFVSGKVKFFSTNADGKIIPYGYSKKNRIIGEATSLFNRVPLLSLQAIEDCCFIGIHLKRHRDKLLHDNRFLLHICSLLGERVSLLDLNIANLLSKPIESRLAAFILQNLENDIFQCSLQECSELIATSYRHTLRIMNQFAERGYLLKKRQRYQVINFDALIKMAGEGYAYYV